MPFTWNERFRLGIADIDKQHQTLLLLLHEALDFYARNPRLLTQPAEKAPLSRDLKKLAAFVQTHFATEENYMHQHAYPQTEEHCREHAALLDTLQNFLAALVGDGPVQPQELVDSLRHWYDRHFTTLDRHLGDYLISRESSE